MLPAPGFAQCVENNQYSMIDPSGNMRLRISGRSRGEVRTVLATLRRQNFLDFIYFTDFETLGPGDLRDHRRQPAAPRTSARPTAKRARASARRSSSRPADFIKGPLHTNDNVRVCGSPTFGRNSRDAIEIVGTPAYETSPAERLLARRSPNYQGTLVNPASALGMPPSNSELANIAEPDYRFYGKHRRSCSPATP